VGCAPRCPACFGEVRKENGVGFGLFRCFPPSCKAADSAGESAAPSRLGSALSKGGTRSSSPSRARSRPQLTRNRRFSQALMPAAGRLDVSSPRGPLASFAAVRFGSWEGFCLNKPTPGLVPRFPDPKFTPRSGTGCVSGAGCPPGRLARWRPQPWRSLKPGGGFN